MFLAIGTPTHSLIGCASLRERSLCLTGYCILRKTTYWLGCGLESGLPGVDWPKTFQRVAGRCNVVYKLVNGKSDSEQLCTVRAREPCVMLKEGNDVWENLTCTLDRLAALSGVNRLPGDECAERELRILARSLAANINSRGDVCGNLALRCTAQDRHEFCLSSLRSSPSPATVMKRARLYNRKEFEIMIDTDTCCTIRVQSWTGDRDFEPPKLAVRNLDPRSAAIVDKSCNILLEGAADVYTLRNYGKRVNCSLTSLYPASVKVLSLGVGLASGQPGLELETGTLHKVCPHSVPAVWRTATLPAGFTYAILKPALNSDVLRGDGGEVSMEQLRNEGAEETNGRSPRKHVDQRHRPARSPHANHLSAGRFSLFKAMWGRPACLIARSKFWFVLTVRARITKVQRHSQEVLIGSFKCGKDSISQAGGGEARRFWSSAGMQEQDKREKSEETRRPAASSGTVSTCENPGATDLADNRTRILVSRVLFDQPTRCCVASATIFLLFAGNSAPVNGHLTTVCPNNTQSSQKSLASHLCKSHWRNDTCSRTYITVKFSLVQNNNANFARLYLLVITATRHTCSTENSTVKFNQMSDGPAEVSGSGNAFVPRKQRLTMTIHRIKISDQYTGSGSALLYTPSLAVCNRLSSWHELSTQRGPQWYECWPPTMANQAPTPAGQSRVGRGSGGVGLPLPQPLQCVTAAASSSTHLNAIGAEDLQLLCVAHISHSVSRINIENKRQ
ncbi:hypothetical protein PR048_032132 [Dryococelus australis]|uniref:Uncharacterized protein n=1 Tax=Dryococelus australis TaxID=614101 RepID=A0ABQ9G1B9_9NEOP|nr:hypothetical protein PR048_032132 [Dryococelus australis]